MARKTKIVELTLDEETVRFELIQFKPRDGHAVLERLTRVAAPIMGALAKNLGAKPGEETIAGDLKLEGLDDAFEAFAANLMKNEGVLHWLVEKIRKNAKKEAETEGVFVSPTTDQWEDLFAGEYGAEFEFVKASLQLNFGSLFKKGGGLGKLARAFVIPTRSRSSSLQGVPSGSGD